MEPAQVHNAGEVTRLLRAYHEGDGQAPDALFNLVYRELKGIAARRLAQMGKRSIDPTELVNEALVRLLGQPLQAVNRQDFFRIAASAIRCALVDIIRRQSAAKRGGQDVAVTLSNAESSSVIGDAWLEVEQALESLERQDARKCRIVELAFLIGLSQQEIADTLEISLTTVERDLRFAKVWLSTRLSP